VIAMTVADIAEVVGGRAVGAADTLVTGAAFVDSRRPVAGGLYVAVVGERVDGHDFASAALSAGAAAVVSQRPLGLPGVVVADPVESIGVLAHHVVSRLADVPAGGVTVVGITGSQGKTSTKDLLGQLLDTAGETVSTVGSLNNEIGVPLTALRASETTRFLVAEMGARGVGHVAYLATMLRPVVAVVLNVGVAHIGEFGSRLAIAEAKGELVEALPADGVAVLNADDPLVLAMRSRSPARVLTFGTAADADLRLGDVRLSEDGRVGFALSHRGARRHLTISLVGEHHALNAAAAATAALACGMAFDRVCDVLESVTARSHWRMELTTSPGGVTVINDAYNANPDSMRAALSTLTALARRPGAGRTFAVLGEMRELGDSADDEHRDLGRLVAQLGVFRLVVVGDGAAAIGAAATSDDSWAGKSVTVPDREAATRYLAGEVADGDLVLVKASRAAGLEEVAMALLDDGSGDGAVRG
jgi:UDP-N-acetylmuramoyl-tripeptide--D-alanyl-D-alanine ligase